MLPRKGKIFNLTRLGCHAQQNLKFATKPSAHLTRYAVYSIARNKFRSQKTEKYRTSCTPHLHQLRILIFRAFFLFEIGAFRFRFLLLSSLKVKEVSSEILHRLASIPITPSWKLNESFLQLYAHKMTNHCILSFKSAICTSFHQKEER